MRIVITGASGLIGSALSSALERDGGEVTRLVRRTPQSGSEVQWDPHARAGGLDPAVLSGAGAVVHLSGAPIASGRWTDARKRELRDSRIASTTALVEAIAAAPAPPPVLLSGSAIGWYGDLGDREVDESAPAASGFLGDLVRDWEAAAAPATAAGVRVVNLRTGIVLAAHGGMLGMLLPLFKFGLGTKFGDGGQWLSWIALTDHVRAMRFLIEQADVAGPVNLTAPAPVTNAEFTSVLARTLGRPSLLRVPAGLLKIGLGEMSTELLGGARVLPAKLRDSGFTFLYPDLSSALKGELSDTKAA